MSIVIRRRHLTCVLGLDGDIMRDCTNKSASTSTYFCTTLSNNIYEFLFLYGVPAVYYTKG